MRKEHFHRLAETIDLRWKIGIVHSLWHAEHIAPMIDAALGVFEKAGIPRAQISLHPAAGSFEVPLIGAALAEAKAVDALIGLGIIVEGETHHADLLASETTRGIMEVQLRYHMPFSFEILYVDALDLAAARADKGAEAAYAALHSLAELHRIRESGL